MRALAFTHNLPLEHSLAFSISPHEASGGLMCWMWCCASRELGFGACACVCSLVRLCDCSLSLSLSLSKQAVAVEAKCDS